MLFCDAVVASDSGEDDDRPCLLPANSSTGVCVAASAETNTRKLLSQRELAIINSSTGRDFLTPGRFCPYDHHAPTDQLSEAVDQ